MSARGQEFACEPFGSAPFADIQRVRLEQPFSTDFVEKLGIGRKQHRQSRSQEKILLPNCFGDAANVASYRR
ncbi:hypothetical protein MEX01_49680 [Methylorubrum extorquens]|nr:hypothetical protein MEX01_49680 [Methylorubrum extorquens]